MEEVKQVSPHEVKFNSTCAAYHKLNPVQFAALHKLYTDGPLCSEHFDPEIFEGLATEELFYEVVNKLQGNLFSCTKFGAAVVLVGVVFEHIKNRLF